MCRGLKRGGTTVTGGLGGNIEELHSGDCEDLSEAGALGDSETGVVGGGSKA